MRLTDYLPNGPAMSTPPSERVRDVIAARHSNENALFSRTGFALLICIFVSLTSALPTFGHNIPQVLVSEGGECEKGVGKVCDTHTLNAEWDEFVRTYPDEEYWYANSHWHMHRKYGYKDEDGDGDIDVDDVTEDGIGGWDKCVADAYIEPTPQDPDGDYNLVGGNCPDGTSTDVITPPPPQNDAPKFTSSATKSIPENSTSVPDKVEAVDDDSQDSVTDYDIVDGADESLFSLNSSGDLTFLTAPNFEAKNRYVVVVEVTSGTGSRVKTATQTITVTVTDVDEPPGTPNAPTVSADSETSLLVTWTAPANEGGPPITGYNYQYKKTSDSDSPENWTEGTTTRLSETIGGLEEGISYDVQIQAKNGEGTSAWSPSGTGSTEANADPEITSPATANVPENTTAVLTVTASDDDDPVTGYSIESGADASLFSIVSSTGVLTFKTAPNFENPQDSGRNNVYGVVVRATSGGVGRVKTVDQTITVTVTDVDEPPGRPNAPSVSAESVTSLMVRWSEPTNEGRPPITGYNYQYKKTSDLDLEANWTEGTTTRLSETISSLDENTQYEVQIQAKNDEGTSMWSNSGTGSTMDNNAPPVFSEETVRQTVDENTRPVLTVQASDEDGDPITYSTPGGQIGISLRLCLRTS